MQHTEIEYLELCRQYELQLPPVLLSEIFVVSKYRYASITRSLILSYFLVLTYLYILISVDFIIFIFIQTAQKPTRPTKPTKPTKPTTPFNQDCSNILWFKPCNASIPAYIECGGIACKNKVACQLSTIFNFHYCVGTEKGDYKH